MRVSHRTGKSLVILAVAVSLLMLLSSFPSRRAAEAAGAQGGSILNLTLVIPPNTLNMVNIVSATSAYYVTELEYPVVGPVYLPNGSLTHERSVQTSISHNGNYTVWTFDINTTKKWSDGTNMSPLDVVATFGPKYVMIPQYDIFGIGPEVAKESAVNATAAVYNLNISDAHFADKLSGQYASSVLYPASFVNNGGINSTNFGTGVGGGPYYTSNYTQGSFQMVMLRNPYFTPAPKVREIDINFVESLSQTAEYIIAGKSDLAPLEPSNAASVLGKPGVGLYNGKGIGGIMTLEYNSSIYPYNQLAFRQALVYGVNQSQLVQQALAGYGINGYGGEGLVSPAATAYYDPGITQYNYDPGKALSLLGSLGMSKGTDGMIHFSNGTVVSLNLWADTDNTADTVAAGVVQRNLQSLGFRVNLQTSTAANIASDYSGNAANIQSAMILFTNTFAAGAIPLYNVEPAWDTYWLPTVAHHNWESPASVDAQYQANYSAWIATGDPSLAKTYQNNIQALNAQNLPTVVLAYPNDLWAYSTTRWTGWPTNTPNSYMDVSTAQLISWAMLEHLQPASAVTSQSSSTASITAASSSSSAQQSTSTSAISSSFAAQATSSPDYTTLYIAVAVIAIIAIAGIALFSRRRMKA